MVAALARVRLRTTAGMDRALAPAQQRLLMSRSPACRHQVPPPLIHNLHAAGLEGQPAVRPLRHPPLDAQRAHGADRAGAGRRPGCLAAHGGCQGASRWCGELLLQAGWAAREGRSGGGRGVPVAAHGSELRRTHGCERVGCRGGQPLFGVEERG